MVSSSNALLCDGCGRTASADHLAERFRRLERATRFRPIHIAALFVAVAPFPRPEDDFYGPPESTEFFRPFLDGLGIFTGPDHAGQAAGAESAALSRLMEFQRKGYYLAYLSECPLTGTEELVAATISRLAPTLVRRIHLNYKPKQITLLGAELAPLAEVLRGVDIGSTVALDQGTALPTHRV